MLLSNNCTYGANGKWACASRARTRSVREGFVQDPEKVNNQSLTYVTDQEISGNQTQNPPPQLTRKDAKEARKEAKQAACPVCSATPTCPPVTKCAVCPVIPAPAGAPNMPSGNFLAWNRAGRFVTKDAQGAGITPGVSTQTAAPLVYEQGTKRIKMQGTNMCMDVYGSEQRDRGSVIWWPCHDSPNQKWVRDAQGRLHPQHVPSKCLDIGQGLNINKPNQLVINTCTDNNPTQIWEAL